MVFNECGLVLKGVFKITTSGSEEFLINVQSLSKQPCSRWHLTFFMRKILYQSSDRLEIIVL